MAKTVHPLFSLSASGTIGGKVTMLSRHGKTVAKWNKPPTGNPSTAQSARRALYAAACLDWRGLSPADKQAWKPAADARRISPFNAYMGDALSAAPPPPPPPASTQIRLLWLIGTTSRYILSGQWPKLTAPPAYFEFF